MLPQDQDLSRYLEVYAPGTNQFEASPAASPREVNAESLWVDSWLISQSEKQGGKILAQLLH